MIVCTVVLQNCYEGKIVKLYIRERLFVEKMHQKKANAETSVLKIRVFQLVGNCKATFQAYESCRRHVKNQLGSNGALEGGLGRGRMNNK